MIAAHQSKKGPNHGGAAKWRKPLRQSGLREGASGAECSHLYYPETIVVICVTTGQIVTE